MTPRTSEPLAPGQLGQPSGVGRVAAAAGEADVDVEQHLADAGSHGGLDRRLGVDGDRDPGLSRPAIDGGEPA